MRPAQADRPLQLTSSTIPSRTPSPLRLCPRLGTAVRVISSSTRAVTPFTWPCPQIQPSWSRKWDRRCLNRRSSSARKPSCQKPRSSESHLSVSTRAAPNATWSYPISRCTSGSTLARSPTSVTTRAAESDFPALTSWGDTAESTRACDPSSVTCANASSHDLITSRRTCVPTPVRSPTRAPGPTAPNDSHDRTNWVATWPCIADTWRRTVSKVEFSTISLAHSLRSLSHILLAQTYRRGLTYNPRYILHSTGILR